MLLAEGLATGILAAATIALFASMTGWRRVKLTRRSALDRLPIDQRDGILGGQRQKDVRTSPLGVFVPTCRRLSIRSLGLDAHGAKILSRPLLKLLCSRYVYSDVHCCLPAYVPTRGGWYIVTPEVYYLQTLKTSVCQAEASWYN